MRYFLLGSHDCLLVVHEVDKWLSVTALTEKYESQDMSEWCRGNLALFRVQTSFFCFARTAEVGRISSVTKESRGEDWEERLKPVLYPAVIKNSRELSIIQQLGREYQTASSAYLLDFF